MNESDLHVATQRALHIIEGQKTADAEDEAVLPGLADKLEHQVAILHDQYGKDPVVLNLTSGLDLMVDLARLGYSDTNTMVEQQVEAGRQAVAQVDGGDKMLGTILRAQADSAEILTKLFWCNKADRNYLCPSPIWSEAGVVDLADDAVGNGMAILRAVVPQQKNEYVLDYRRRLEHFLVNFGTALGEKAKQFLAI